MQETLVELPPELLERLPAYISRKTRVNAENGCLVYTGYTTPKGYARTMFQVNGAKYRVRLHRAVWILEHGPIADPALVIDHTCGNKACLNIEHLELVTDIENLQRSDERLGRQRRRPPGVEPERCVNGHDWAANRQVTTWHDRERVRCRSCARATGARWYAKQRATVERT